MTDPERNEASFPAQIRLRLFWLVLVMLQVAMLTACTAPDDASVDDPRLDDASYLDRLLDTDDATHCDAIGWAMITPEFAPTPPNGDNRPAAEVTPTMSAEYRRNHAACWGGDRGIRLMASCFEPLCDPGLLLALGPEMMGLGCAIVADDGTIPGVLLEPADFSLVDATGAVYPMNLAATAAERVVGLTVLQTQALAPGSETRGYLGFALPDNLEPPYLLEWTPRVNNRSEEPLWIVLDRFMAIPAPLK
jgi:hypothetical protein